MKLLNISILYRKKWYQMNDIQYVYSRLSNWRNDSPFYDDNLHENSNENLFYISETDDSWNNYVDDGWHYVMNKGQFKQLPKQGWKIHITASVVDAQELLYSVSSFLIKKQISFKFIPSYEELKMFNSKYADRTESGKFITIYPQSKEIFLLLLDQLKKITDVYEEGPYILNDKSWKQSHVFFRYGGFKKMMIHKKSGEDVTAIMDPDGNLIEDKRVPYYYLPDFVKEPDKIKKDVYTIPDSELQELKQYQVIRSLHYSNGGGVYEASVGNKKRILKEGRKGAGLDAHGTDGYQRINREFEFLKRLKDAKGIVSVYKKFTVWKSNYLVEDLAEGIDLGTYLVESFPFVRDLSNSVKQRQSYNQQTQSIITQLIDIVNQAHNYGVAFGDLQPANVIYSHNNDSVKIIDLESAADVSSKYRPGLQTMGYVPTKIRTFGDADWYALKCIAYSLYMPALVSPSLVPNIYFGLKIKIREEFGDDAIKFLDHLDEIVSRHIDFEFAATGGKNGLSLPNKIVSAETVPTIALEVFNGIVNNLNPRSTGLIKGTFRQHKDLMSEYAIATGGFGGIMALERFKRRDIQDITAHVGLWVKRILPILQKMPDESSTKLGLFDGLAGICSVLYDLGLERESLDILSRIKVNLFSKDYTLFSGLSGIGLGYLSFFSMTQKKSFLAKAIEIADSILSDKEEISNRVKSESGGLLTGWSGVALFLSTLGNYINQVSYQESAALIVDSVLKDQLASNNNDYLMVKDAGAGSLEGRVFPYLGNGSVGVALTLLELKRQGNQFVESEQMEDDLKKLIQAGYSSCTVFGGLFEGYAGFTVLGNAIKAINKSSRLLHYVAKGLNSFLAGYHENEILIPSDIGFKCSMDLARGASGVLTALSDVDTGKWNSWFPLPNKSKLFLFQEKV